MIPPDVLLLVQSNPDGKQRLRDMLVELRRSNPASKPDFKEGESQHSELILQEKKALHD